MVDQACGCEADSGDPDYSCDCAMQGHCICSSDCQCKTLTFAKKLQKICNCIVITF